MITIHNRRAGQPSFPEIHAAFLTGNALQLARDLRSWHLGFDRARCPGYGTPAS